MATESKRVNAITAKAADETFELIISLPKSITFDVAGTGDVALDLEKVHGANMSRALVRGWYERFKDAAAVNRADGDGNIIPSSEHARIKYERMNDLAIHFESGAGEWSRKGDGTGVGSRAIAVEAFARRHGCAYNEAKERIERRAKQTDRSYQQQCAIVRKLFAGDVRAIEEERAAKATPTGFNADDEIAGM